MFMQLSFDENGVHVLKSTHCFELTDNHELIAHEYGGSDLIILKDDKTRNVLFKMNRENDRRRDFILGMEIIKNYYERGRLDIKVVSDKETLYGSLAFDIFNQNAIKDTSSKIQCSFNAIGGVRGFPDGITISHSLDRSTYEFATGPAICGVFQFFWDCCPH